MNLEKRVARLEYMGMKRRGSVKYAVCREEFEAMQRELSAMTDEELFAEKATHQCDSEEEERFAEMTDFELFCYGCQEKCCGLAKRNKWMNS